jgi:hypothetical protein
MSTFGTDTAIDAALADYLPQTDSLPRELLQDETNALLYAALLELQLLRYDRTNRTDPPSLLIEEQEREAGNQTEARGRYLADVYEVTDSEWTEVDLSFDSKEIDLRNLTDPVKIAFAPPAGGSNIVRYDSTDSPVAGIPVTTRKVWLRARDGVGSTAVYMEVWSQR